MSKSSSQEPLCGCSNPDCLDRKLDEKGAALMSSLLMLMFFEQNSLQNEARVEWHKEHNPRALIVEHDHMNAVLATTVFSFVYTKYTKDELKSYLQLLNSTLKQERSLIQVLSAIIREYDTARQQFIKLQERMFNEFMTFKEPSMSKESSTPKLQPSVPYFNPRPKKDWTVN